MAVPARMIVVALLAASATAWPASGIVSAQETEAGMTREIIVQAPRSVPLPAERSPFTGAPIVTSTVRIPVFYDDLDLVRPRDQERLVTRVQRVAQDVCKELDRLYPFDPDGNCVSKAVGSGSDSAKAAIAAVLAGK